MCDVIREPYDNSIQQSERLFKILQKLNSIKKTSQLLGESEQFILGIERSTQVIYAEIQGIPLKKQ